MNLVPYAVPFFVLLIVLELGWGWFTDRNTYRINDGISSVMLGVMSTSSKLVVLDVGARVFSTVEQDLSWWRLDLSSPMAWLWGILVFDFCYYWFHRISHERQILWASHVAHHQSEEFNLSTALRQTSTAFLFSWLFYIPCFVLGMPISMFVTIASAHLIYQFWIHTRFIPKLGPFEWVFVSPSNHRVHHGQNPDYIDKNHGGLLILWDRLFGTFKEECDSEPTVYGVRTVLRSWNPLWANMQIYWQMMVDSWHTDSRRDKWRIWWSRTGWRPADVIDRYPVIKSNLQHVEKFDATPGTAANIWILAHFALLIPVITGYEAILASLPTGYRWTYLLLLFYTLYVIGAALENKAGLLGLEILRWLLVATALVAGAAKMAGTAKIPETLTWWSAVYLVTSAAFMVFAIRKSHPPALIAREDQLPKST